MASGRITVTRPDAESYTIEVEEGETLKLGRLPGVPGERKLVLEFCEVSGQHAEIRCKTSGWTVVDSGSTNGTTLNGARLTPGREYGLDSGDIVQIAHYDLQVSPPAGSFAADEEDDDKRRIRLQLERFRLQRENFSAMIVFMGISAVLT